MKNTNEKSSKQNANSDRLIARMVLGLGLSLTIASAVVAGITHPKFSDVRDEYIDAVNEKADYLDTYEQTDEFKTTYNADVNALNNRLIAREIDAHTYESELEKLNDNNYTEKVIVETSDVQTQAKFTEINQKISSTSHEFDKYAIPCAVTALTSFMLPVVSIYNYSMFKEHEKNNDKDQIEPYLHV